MVIISDDVISHAEMHLYCNDVCITQVRYTDKMQAIKQYVADYEGYELNLATYIGYGMF